ncbi:DNA-protecting protein DprA [Candidatus Uhrbacteria bacterium]|nr:DNA-protecting protein DprA [Candidatus Uhrbacteria bacterium]
MSIAPEDRAYWVALVQFRSFGAVRMERLMRHFPTMKRAFEASAGELVEAGIEPKIASHFLGERIHIDPEALMRELEIHGVQAVTLKDDIYPPLLKEIYDPPAVLFVRGALPDPARRHLAVVGSRKASDYGTRVTQDLVKPLAQAGVVVVSGLAYGIDAIAHDTALAADGTTLAVLGSGVDEQSIYPSANRALASRILSQGGALISEFPLGTLPLKSHFPFRNRIIAGLCHGTLVVEAALKSGSLITARCALESGREVYAVPGSIYSQTSEGPHNLIKLGATPASCAQDIFGLEAVPQPVENAYQPRGEEETLVWERLGSMPIHLDELIRATQMPAQKTTSVLTLMEIKGAVRHHGGNFFARA